MKQPEDLAGAIEALRDELRKLGADDVQVVCGGVIPPQDYDFLREAGVQGIYGPGSYVVESGADMLRLLRNNMPPAGHELDEAAE